MARCIEENRKPGDKDRSSFFRKGIYGDWKDYFTARHREIFDEEAGEPLERFGYERISARR